MRLYKAGNLFQGLLLVARSIPLEERTRVCVAFDFLSEGDRAIAKIL
ncbi:MAG: hypothetical protein ACHBN1_02085 [Heteroscytonema crispum UTEX LB 1556]